MIERMRRKFRERQERTSPYSGVDEHGYRYSSADARARASQPVPDGFVSTQRGRDEAERLHKEQEDAYDRGSTEFVGPQIPYEEWMAHAAHHIDSHPRNQPFTTRSNVGLYDGAAILQDHIDSRMSHADGWSPLQAAAHAFEGAEGEVVWAHENGLMDGDPGRYE